MHLCIRLYFYTVFHRKFYIIYVHDTISIASAQKIKDKITKQDMKMANNEEKHLKNVLRQTLRVVSA